MFGHYDKEIKQRTAQTAAVSPRTKVDSPSTIARTFMVYVHVHYEATKCNKKHTCTLNIHKFVYTIGY